MDTFEKTEFLNPTGGLSIGITDINGKFIAKNLSDENADLILSALKLLDSNKNAV